jgi:hypothetical protein
MSPLEQEMNVSAMPAPMVAEMRKGREEALARVTDGLPPDLVAALRPRAAALRAQQRALVASGSRRRASGADPPAPRRGAAAGGAVGPSVRRAVRAAVRAGAPAARAPRPG